MSNDISIPMTICMHTLKHGHFARHADEAIMNQSAARNPKKSFNLLKDISVCFAKYETETAAVCAPTNLSTAILNQPLEASKLVDEK